MNYFSTRDHKKLRNVSFASAVMQGLAPDGGLFMPENIPLLPKSFFSNLRDHSPEEIASTIASAFIAEEIPGEALKKIIEETLNFPIPLQKIDEDIFMLELFHGPTMAFKDVGARFMARVMGYFLEKEKKKAKVIVATSGDTGSAVASGFYNLEGIEVYILYPSKKISPLQEKQLTTWGGNIHAIEVEGNFDDCQHIAKQLLADRDLSKNNLITSANSINIARVIPQSFYYFFACHQLKESGKAIAISVPSGNFGNLTAGLLAKRMGLPIRRFIAATNANEVVPKYLHDGIYEPKASLSTISNAMDVGSPSNFERMNYLFDADVQNFRKEISGYSFSDPQTREAIASAYRNNNYLLDPHGAVAYLGMKKFMEEQSEKHIGIFLETAHPAKFKETVEDVVGKHIEIPEKLAAFAQKEKRATLCANNITAAKELVASKYLS